MNNVLAIFEFLGDSEDLRQKYDKLLYRVVEVSSARPIIHLAVPVTSGLNIYDVWDSEEVFRSFSENPEFIQVLESFGMSNPKITVYPVHGLEWPVSAIPMYR